MQCSYVGCENTFKNHRWGSIKAHSYGWFIQKDGTAWCPSHIPEWVENWRKKNNG